LLTSLQNYSLEEAKFGKVERQIVSMMGLEHLAKAKHWPELLIDEHSRRLYELRRDLFHLKNFLPKFLKLIEQDFVEVMKHDPNKAPSNLQGKALITVIIIEEKNSFSNPRRVIETLEAVELFYNAVSILNGESAEQKMILLACDSGSDKSFDFLGLAKLVEMVKEIVLSLWDRVIFYREKQMGERIDLIAKSLPVIERKLWKRATNSTESRPKSFVEIFFVPLGNLLAREQLFLKLNSIRSIIRASSWQQNPNFSHLQALSFLKKQSLLM
jgi:hypothetical protein